jgi:hypothetical protein
MMAEYPTPPGDGMAPIVDEFRKLARRISELERPSGTSIGSLVAQVQAALVDLNAAVIAETEAYLSSGTVNVANLSASGSASITGPIYSPHGRANPVTTSYVSAWLNSDGRIGASASSLKFKQDFEPADTTAEVEALLTVALIRYRYIADVEARGNGASWHLGTLAEYMAETALREWVPLDQKGEPFAINWEHLIIPAIAAIQKAHAEQLASNARQDSLEARIVALEG